MLHQTFGIEIECLLPAGMSRADAAAKLREAGCDVQDEGYNHITRTHWKIVTDSSLGDPYRGAEFVSPVLTGPEGLANARKLCDELVKLGCTINTRCGLHVHVGARGRDLDWFKRLFRLYAHFEPGIDRVMPLSRREARNSYCQPVANALRIIEQATTLRDLGRVRTRYWKLNVLSYLTHGTVEFRHHSGTIEADKVCNWVLLCLGMTAKADRPEAELGASEPQPIVYRGHQVTARSYPGRHAQLTLMRRPEGATDEELCRIAGLRVAGAPLTARIFGYQYRTRTIDGVKRHYAINPLAAPAPLPTATIDGLLGYVGASSEVASFYAARAAHFAGRA